MRFSGAMATIRSPFADRIGEEGGDLASWLGPALNRLASTSTARAGALPELNSSSSNSIVDLVVVDDAAQRVELDVDPRPQPRRDDARDRGWRGVVSSGGGRGPAGAGRRRRRLRRVRRASICGPPARASGHARRLRQKQERAAGAERHAANSHGRKRNPALGRERPAAAIGREARREAGSRGRAAAGAADRSLSSGEATVTEAPARSGASGSERLAEPPRAAAAAAARPLARAVVRRSARGSAPDAAAVSLPGRARPARCAGGVPPAAGRPGE